MISSIILKANAGGGTGGFVADIAGKALSVPSSKCKVQLEGCIITGEAGFGGTNTTYGYLCQKVLIGTGLYIHTDNHLLTTSYGRELGVLILGKYNKDNVTDTDTNALVVGAGTSKDDRSNCFATGNDGTNDYIYIGDTKLTETQLQALLATL